MCRLGISGTSVTSTAGTFLPGSNFQVAGRQIYRTNMKVISKIALLYYAVASEQQCIGPAMKLRARALCNCNCNNLLLVQSTCWQCWVNDVRHRGSIRWTSRYPILSDYVTVLDLTAAKPVDSTVTCRSKILQRQAIESRTAYSPCNRVERGPAHRHSVTAESKANMGCHISKALHTRPLRTV